MALLLPSIAIFLGFIALMWGADRFVAGAADVATSFGVSRVIIGLTIVAFGTSAPEMIVSATAAFQGGTDLCIGNALGSNIANIALVLGCAILLRPLTVHPNIIRIELPMLLVATVIVGLFFANGDLSRLEGAALLSGLAASIFWSVRQGMKEHHIAEQSGELQLAVGRGLGMEVFWFVIGLAALLGSSRLLVWGAIEIARYLHVEELIIGLSVVAFGTSLPELAATVVAARRDEHDIAIGNIVGSNLFNLLGVLALPGLIAPGRVPAVVNLRDYPVMLGLSFFLWISARWLPPRRQLGRWEGILLVLGFVTYVAYLFVGKH